MKQRSNPGEDKVDLEYLVEKYRGSKEECYFNDLWEGVKLFSIKVCQKYVTINKQDKESISMEVLFNCLTSTYNKEKGKFLTFYGTALRNRLNDTISKQNTYKETLNTSALSTDKLKTDIGYEIVDNKQHFDVNMFISECKLVSLEIKIIQLIYIGYNRKEITSKLELKPHEYIKLITNIRNKVKSNYLFERVL